VTTASAGVSATATAEIAKATMAHSAAPLKSERACRSAAWDSGVGPTLSGYPGMRHGSCGGGAGALPRPVSVFHSVSRAPQVEHTVLWGISGAPQFGQC